MGSKEDRQDYEKKRLDSKEYRQAVKRIGCTVKMRG